MKKILSIVFVLSLIALPVLADTLAPRMFFARNSKIPRKDTFFVWGGNKYSCDAPADIFFETEAEAKEMCNSCFNREVKHLTSEETKKILRKYNDSFYSLIDVTNKNIEEGIYACVLKSIKECSADKPLLDNVSWNFNVCSVCDNRNIAGDFCVLKCPAERPIEDYEGNCHACDETKIIQLTGAAHNCYFRHRGSSFILRDVVQDKVCSDRVVGRDDCAGINVPKERCSFLVFSEDKLLWTKSFDGEALRVECERNRDE